MQQGFGVSIYLAIPLCFLLLLGYLVQTVQVSVGASSFVVPRAFAYHHLQESDRQVVPLVSFASAVGLDILSKS